MSGEIINRVANSPLITIDLADYAPDLQILEIDLKQFLFEGFILKEKEFRKTLKEFDFSIYTNKVVALFCSSDAIVPMWAYMLATSYLNPLGSEIYFGTKENGPQLNAKWRELNHAIRFLIAIRQEHSEEALNEARTLLREEEILN